VSPSPDLVIIGGGVAGAATAFHAARAGLRPLLLERRSALCTLTTPASTGAFRLQFDNEEELRLVRESVELFLTFNEATGSDEYDLGIRQQGYVWCTTEDAGVARQRRLVGLQHGWGQTDIEILDGDEVRRRFPYIRDTVVGARFRAGDGFLDPKALTLGLARASGAEIRTECEVVGFDHSGGKLTAVQTTGGSIAAERAVIACGPFSGAVAGRAGVALPVGPVIRQKVILPALPEVPADAPMTIDEDIGTHWRPALRGAYLLFTDPSTPAGLPREDVPTDHRFAFRLLDPRSPVAAARIAPFWESVWARSSAHWLLQAGQYTMTPDHRPLIGETEIEGLWVNTGYSGHGIMGSPAGSRILLDALTGRISPGENPFRPDRAFLPRERDVL
jgi:sarcosine oxidase subunit beta